MIDAAIDPALILRAYAVGVFPMADARDADSIYWVEPRRRAVLPLDGFHLSRSLRRTIVRDRFRVTADRAFDRIIALCAEAADNRPDTWINHPIEEVFRQLHRIGLAHSIECWDGDRLVGGLYGLALGRAFFGESMVSRATDASKVAIAHLAARLRAGGFTLLDCQFMTAHLATLGAVEIDREDYLSALLSALAPVRAVASSSPLSPADWAAGADFGAFDVLVGEGAGESSGSFTAQLLAHTS